MSITKVVLMFIVMVNVVRTDKRLKAMLLLVLITSCTGQRRCCKRLRDGKIS